MGIFSKINFGLSKTRNKMSGAIDDMLDSFDSFEDDLYMELEEILVMGDVGVTTAVQVVEELKNRVKSEKIKKPSEVKKELQSIIADLLYGGEDMGLITIPSVILVIGVNGAGKTTTIGKMAAMYKAEGKKVILGAADTFRAAAIDQLDVWAQRAGVDIIKHKEGADPAAVIFDTIQAGIARNCDIIICDTAGRLHNKKNLMEELGKIYRVMDKELPYADREVLLVLDATTGQNAVNQAREFASVAEITGIVLTKLDGTARGGVVLSIKNELKIPVKFIGVGEKIDDLQPFDPAAFAKSLFEEAKGTEDDNENSLEELINSEEYKNYVPEEAEMDEESREAREAIEELFTGLAAQAGVRMEEPADEGQADGDAHEAGEEGAVAEASGADTPAPAQETGSGYENAPEGAADTDGREQSAAVQASVDDIIASMLAAQPAAPAVDKEKAEAERIAAEKAEAERIAAEKAEAERIAAEKAEAERIAAEKAEAERIAAEKAEAERIAAEKAEAERIAAEKAEAERIAAEKAERIAAEKAEAERIAAEKAEAERIAAEKAEAERIAAEKAEAERIAAEKAEAERIAAEKAEAARIAAEKAEAARKQAEESEKKKRRGLFGIFNRHS